MPRYNLQPNKPRPMSAVRAQFAVGKRDARWRFVPDRVQAIDTLRRLELQQRAR